MYKKVATIFIVTVLILAVVESLTAQPGGRTRRSRGFSSSIMQPPLPANEQEKMILDVIEDLNPNRARGMMNVPEEDGRILRLLTESTNAKHVVEIGTSNGYSGLWFCLALRTTGGKLTTHEIDSGRAQLARENFKRAGVDNMITLVEGNAHDTVTRIKEPIDILFIDADKPGYPDYLNKLLPLVRPGGLILSHNIDSTGSDYVRAITTDSDLETVQTQGVTVTLKKRQSGTTEAKEN